MLVLKSFVRAVSRYQLIIPGNHKDTTHALPRYGPDEKAANPSATACPWLDRVLH